MSTTQTTVVTRQVTSTRGDGSTTVTTGNRTWNTKLFGCCENCKLSCLVLLCPLCCAAKLSARVGENPLVPCCVPGGIIALRTKVRLMLGIKGTICNDCCVSTLCACGLCVICQMIRELDTVGWPK